MNIDKYIHSEVEDNIYSYWEKNELFKPKKNSKKYSIVIPPPNVTGSLHMGHALNNTLQDILTRYHRMIGRDVLWQPGCDHAGIATQMVVERQLETEGKTRHDFGREAFINKIWDLFEKSTTYKTNLKKTDTNSLKKFDIIINEISSNIESFHFNKSVAKIYEYVNLLSSLVTKKLIFEEDFSTNF